jgi:hypothetical protein
LLTSEFACKVLAIIYLIMYIDVMILYTG